MKIVGLEAAVSDSQEEPTQLVAAEAGNININIKEDGGES